MLFGVGHTVPAPLGLGAEGCEWVGVCECDVVARYEGVTIYLVVCFFIGLICR